SNTITATNRLGIGYLPTVRARFLSRTHRDHYTIWSPVTPGLRIDRRRDTGMALRSFWSPRVLSRVVTPTGLSNELHRRDRSPRSNANAQPLTQLRLTHLVYLQMVGENATAVEERMLTSCIRVFWLALVAGGALAVHEASGCG